MYAEKLIETETPYGVAFSLLLKFKQKLETATRSSRVIEWADAELAALAKLPQVPVETDEFATAEKTAVDVPADGTIVEVSDVGV